MTTAVREAPHHETLTCYANYGCRRPECVERKRAWARQRDRGLRAGTWQPRIDAAPARAHLQQLIEAGLTQQSIADTIGVPRQSISDFFQHRNSRRGIRHSTSPELAEKILAVRPDTITAGRVDATGTHRRIQALVAAGWPLVHIGPQLGMHRQRPEQILRVDRIYVSTRSQVAEGYERVQRMRPERRGVPKDKIRQSKNRAEALRWPTPRYWARYADAIDDPHFEPMYGRTRGELLAADARELQTYGISVEQAAERLGVTKAHLYQELLRHPEATEPAVDAELAA
jgi:predicted transcriptional regulator